MSALKWIIGLVVLVAIGAGLYFSGWLGNIKLPGQQTQTTQQPATTTPTQTQQQPVSDLPTQSNDASDAAIVQDSAAVDAQLTSLSSDSAGIDQSLNDKPVTQEY